MIKAILFDVDGTLVDSKRYTFDTFNIALNDIGEATIDEKAFFEFAKTDGEDRMGYYASEVLRKPEKAKPLLMAFVRRYVETLENKLSLLPGTKETLKQLKARGIRIGILTDQHKIMLDMILNKFSLAPDASVTREDVERKKPHGEGVKKLCDMLGVDIKNTLVVGDWIGDILAAKNAGARSVAVLTGVSNREEFEKAGADKIINGIHELPQLIELF